MKRSIAIIGAGPASLMLAAMLSEQSFDITIYERNNAVARKFLVAGDGGFNLTHSEDIEQLITRYTPQSFLENSIRSFTNNDLRNWLKSIDINTYIGTSKRVFPVKGIKPIDALNAILKKLKTKNVEIKTKHFWQGWNDKKELIFFNNNNELIVKADIVVFALGGASWGKTGSDGSWINLFKNKGIEIIPFQASNCAYEVKWDQKMLEQTEGKSLKNITVSCSNKIRKGEFVITNFGIEGGVVYALSPQIRKQLNEKGTATIFVDLKPALSVAELKIRLRSRGNKSYTKRLQEQLNFNIVQITLLKTILTKEEFIDPEIIADKIKHLPLQISSMAAIDKAISTVGGVSLNAVDDHFQLKKIRHHYIIGEMLDWDAPTGGYLLQACFSMGNYLAQYLNGFIF